MPHKLIKPPIRLGDRLRARGFDKTRYNRYDNSYSVKCSQCAALVINGVACHERGCPNENRTRRTNA